MWFLQLHDPGCTQTETCSTDNNTLRISLQFTLLNFFKDFGLFPVCSILFSTPPPITTLLPIVSRSQVMYPSRQQTRNSLASRYKLFNSADIARSLSFSFFANRACVSVSVSYVVYVSAICFQSCIPTSSFVLLVN